MDDQTRSRMQVTNGVLHMTNSALQGRFVALNVLGMFERPESTPEAIQETRDSIDFIRTGLIDLVNTKPWFDFYDGSPLSAECDRAYKLFDQVRIETTTVETTLFEIHRTGKWSEQPQMVQTLLAWLNAQAYAREHYVSGQVRFHEVMGQEDQADYWRQGLLSCQEEKQMAEALLDVYRAGEQVGNRFWYQLRDHTLLLPFAYSNRRQDMNSVFGYLVNEYTWETAEFTPEGTAKWQGAGFDVKSAIPWSVYRINPEEIPEWLAIGFKRAVDIANWKYRQFAPETAAPWIAEGFDAVDARINVLTGVSLEQAKLDRREQQTQ